MIVSVPSSAPRTPPETGASSSSTPRAAARSASARVRSGSDEPMSISVAPAGIRSSTPSSSRTASTIAEVGSIRDHDEAAAAPRRRRGDRGPVDVGEPARAGSAAS